MRKRVCVFQEEKIKIRQKQTQMCVKKWCVFFIERKRERDNVCVCVCARVCVCLREGKRDPISKEEEGMCIIFFCPFLL